ncbi:hypothetical protein EUX98_g7530 [Antrodiella citrinella]|uniref:Ubiquitin-like protease family profile domain-containing protein n=1 Tax=Antrodiella citrinella TaxID=2447956 RepID=A0A4S4MLU9_9APHY|nr:hypothetical protein EUX98_g7530 [Antrodiella citrinella]
MRHSSIHIREIPPTSTTNHLITTNTTNTPIASEFQSSLIVAPAVGVSGSYPELDAAIVKVGRARAGDGRVVKSYRERPHIYDRKHKKETPLYWKKTLEEMKQELFEIHKKRGYRSGYDEFQGWLAYGMQLDGTKDVNDVKAVLSPSTSFSDLRERAKNIEFRARRNTGAEDFLRRALQKARATISSPPAPRFSGYDAIRNAQREQDEAIDKRIRPPFPTSLPPKDDAEVDKYLRQRGATWKCAREQVSDTDLTRLHPSQWLNDEIINFYGAMIMKRATENKENAGKKGKKLLNVHYFSSFFWSKLKTVGYEKGRLAKWTKAFDIFEKDVVLIPVNHNNAHWTAAAINFAKKRIESYDSMGMDRSSVYKLLREYVSAEFRNKKKKEFDWTGWTDYVMEDTPQQENGYDCGVFTCQFLESISRGESSFPFTQQNMPYLRRRMIWEICHSQLREDS